MNKNVIGIGGLMTAGKDEVADRLVSHHGYTKHFMSKPLLDVFLTLNPVVPAYVQGEGAVHLGKSHVPAQELYRAIGEDYTLLKTNNEVRRFLQALGTDVGRNMIDENLWVNLAEKRIQKALLNNEKIALTGIRFPNELEMVERLGRTYVESTTLWVDRPGIDTSRVHVSENSVSAEHFQEVITNDGSLEDLYRTVDEWIAA